MPSENVDLVNRWTDAWNRDDWEMLAALSDPDVTTVAPEQWPESEILEGWEALRQQIERLKDSWEEERIELDEIREAGDTVVVRSRWVTRGKASGVPLELPMTTVSTVTNGRVARLEFHVGHAAADRAVRPSEQRL